MLAYGPCVTIFFDYEGKWASPEAEASSRIGVLQVLDYLHEEGIRATFNVVGGLLVSEETIIRRIINAGHEIASHTCWHEVVSSSSQCEMHDDIEGYRRLLAPYGVSLNGFRAPESRWSPPVIAALEEAGLRWDAEDDFAPTPYIIRRSQSGGHLWRMPVVTDDWKIEGMQVPPAQMLVCWEEAVHGLLLQQRYGAIGFHPWILGKDPERMLAFRAFLRFLRQQKKLSILPFGEVARVCESRLAPKEQPL